MKTLEELSQTVDKIKKTGNSGWVEVELLLYIAEALDDIRHLLKEKE